MSEPPKDIIPNYATPDDFQEDENDFRLSGDALPILYSTDWTSGTAVNQITRNIIDLDPRFQRRDAWMPADKSKFIESLALHIPIPQIILAEHPDYKRKYIVIDGKQRLLTLVQFLSSDEQLEATSFRRLKLSGLQERRDLNGKIFNDIKDNEDGSSIENAVIRTVIINGVRDENFLYEVFLRLNTLGKSLSPQELRQALAPGPFTNFLDDTASENKQIRLALNLSKPDRRMRDNELLLRYFAFRLHLHEYDGDFKRFMDKTTKQGNKDWADKEDYYKSWTEKMSKAIDLTFRIFGKNAFQSYERGVYTGRFNRAVFDIMVYFFSEETTWEPAAANSKAVEAAFQNLCETNQEFRGMLSVNTKEVLNVFTRYSTWGSALSEALNVKLPDITYIKESNRIVVAA